MSATDGPLLVLGIGNVLLRDEGAGVLVIRELEARLAAGSLELPPDTRLLDGGTLGLDLLPIISDARALVMIDAVDLRSEPGTVRVIRGDEIHSTLAGHVSPHQVGVSDLVATARLLGTLPASVALVGIQAGDIAIGLEPTPMVAAAILVAADTVAAEIAGIVAGPAEGPRTAAGPTETVGHGAAAAAGSGQAVPTPPDGLIGTGEIASTVVSSG